MKYYKTRDGFAYASDDQALSENKLIMTIKIVIKVSASGVQKCTNLYNRFFINKGDIVEISHEEFIEIIKAILRTNFNIAI